MPIGANHSHPGSHFTLTAVIGAGSIASDCNSYQTLACFAPPLRLVDNEFAVNPFVYTLSCFPAPLHRRTGGTGGQQRFSLAKQDTFLHTAQAAADLSFTFARFEAADTGMIVEMADPDLALCLLVDEQ